jgi:hypothetical protein
MGDRHAVEHRRSTVPESAPRAYGFAEHVMGIWGREMYPDAEVGAHLAGDNIFKHIVRESNFMTGANTPDWE